MVVHRDLKPENILFRRPKDNDIIITDLGLATRLHYYQDNYGIAREMVSLMISPGFLMLPFFLGTTGQWVILRLKSCLV
jgi:serine/threonine protein kinase